MIMFFLEIYLKIDPLMQSIETPIYFIKYA